ncbi:glycosyltransferase family 4 protein [Phenylobacterium sp.]|uniref:glycosyltransferase family 4 protein n=1 Tax=Phenylobacterium sp. TaxID=1871053 RepID=UPI001215903C|nr:glycosyltransferase family 4 protein [Phenylobacterium sp.]THD70134.1 MAG: glycosyltransferase [Phenylobacterium sp.]
MANRLAIYHPRGELGLGENFFGKDVANLQLFQAMARYGGFEQIDILSAMPATEAHLREALLDDPAAPIRITRQSILSTSPAQAAGVALRGQPDLQNAAWLRRLTSGDRSYSLIGLIHTLAPPAIRQGITLSLTAPVHPWDAIICTSPSVREATAKMLDDWGALLAERTNGSPPPQPALPIIPLGVDAHRIAVLADRPQARAKVRAQLGLGEADILVLWVGRLSFFEKAFPQAMFQAVQIAARTTGLNIHFAMAGWFPSPERDRGFYEEAARVHAPDAKVHFLDGNDRTLVGELWAGADIFTSLVDNIQETFGITPVEAMAAGLPVVVSDWDGYRFTVRDGIEGFLIPTLGGPASGVGLNIVQRHLFQITSYQTFAGEVSQHTAVHVGRAGAAIGALARNRHLRKTMGAAGRERVRSMLDWPVVARQISALADDLAEIRKASPDPVVRQKADPGRGDPFIDFAGFATQVLTADTRLSAVAGVNGDDVRGLTAVLDKAFANVRASLEDCAMALDLLASGKAASAREIMAAFPVEKRRAVEMGLAWMAKLGLIDWLA